MNGDNKYQHMAYNNNGVQQSTNQVGYQPGRPITEVANSTPQQFSNAGEMRQANHAIYRTLGLNDLIPDSEKQYFSQQGSTQSMHNAQTFQGTQPTQHADPLVREMAKEFLADKVRRAAQDSLPEFLRQNNGGTTQQQPYQQPNNNNLFGLNNSGAQPNNQQFGGQGQAMPNNTNGYTNASNNQNPNNQQAPQHGYAASGSSNSDWFKSILGDNVSQPASQQTNGGSQAMQQQSYGQQNNNTNNGGNQDLIAYGNKVTDYNARMMMTAVQNGIDADRFKQTMNSMTPEQSAQLVIDYIARSNNGMPQTQFQQPQQHNGQQQYQQYQNMGYNTNQGQMLNGQQQVVQNQGGYLPSNLPPAPTNLSIANMPGAQGVQATGRSTITRRPAWGSES